MDCRLYAKVVLLGPQAVGKTSLINALTKGTFDDRVVTTTAPSVASVTYVVSDSMRVQLNIWDTAGQERFRSMSPMYYHGTDVVIVVYDITSLESLVAAKSWLKDAQLIIDKLIQICVVGNKMDIESNREVPTRFGEEFAQSVGAIFTETSAKENKGLNNVLREVAESIVECYKLAAAESSENFLSSNHYDTESFQLADFAENSSSLQGSREHSTERQLDKRKKFSCCQH